MGFACRRLLVTWNGRGWDRLEVPDTGGLALTGAAILLGNLFAADVFATAQVNHGIIAALTIGQSLDEVRLRRAVAMTFARSVAVVGLLAVMGLSVHTQTPASQWDGVYTAEQAGRGEKIYAERCAGCHGADLGGAGAPGVAGADFATSWNDVSLKDLYERVQVTMPADQPGVLTPSQAAEVIAYMLAKGDYPAGNNELPAELEKLAAVKFFAKNPAQK